MLNSHFKFDFISYTFMYILHLNVPWRLCAIFLVQRRWISYLFRLKTRFPALPSSSGCTICWTTSISDIPWFFKLKSTYFTNLIKLLEFETIFEGFYDSSSWKTRWRGYTLRFSHEYYYCVPQSHLAIKASSVYIRAAQKTHAPAWAWQTFVYIKPYIYKHTRDARAAVKRRDSGKRRRRQLITGGIVCLSVRMCIYVIPLERKWRPSPTGWRSYGCFSVEWPARTARCSREAKRYFISERGSRWGWFMCTEKRECGHERMIKRFWISRARLLNWNADILFDVYVYLFIGFLRVL